jgi:hypothetical protein
VEGVNLDKDIRRNRHDHVTPCLIGNPES